MAEIENRKEACRTYIEQTKLLVTLASGFIIAPPAAIAMLASGDALVLADSQVSQLFWSEIAFVASVLFGYLTLGSVAGSQDEGNYDIYRGATRFLSWLQILSYLGGLVLLSLMIQAIVKV